MKSGQFLKVVSKAYQVDEKTLFLFARLLKEAGLITTGARGVNAPDLLPIDAARLTIALLATDKPSKAVESVKEFGRMTVDPNDKRTVGKGFGAALGCDFMTFEEALACCFLPNFETSELIPYVEINENGRYAMIEHRRGKSFFWAQGLNEDQMSARRQKLPGIRRIRGVSSHEISQISTVFLFEDPEYRAAHPSPESLDAYLREAAS